MNLIALGFTIGLALLIAYNTYQKDDEDRQATKIMIETL